MRKAAGTTWDLPEPPPADPPQEIGGRIRFVRERVKDWSQGRLAEEAAGCGIPVGRTTINRIEQGAQRPTFGQLLVIAAALDVSMGQLGATSDEYPELKVLRDPDASKYLATARYLSRKSHLTKLDGHGRGRGQLNLDQASLRSAGES